MLKLQKALKVTEKLQKIRDVVEKGKKAWQEKTGKTWSAKDPIEWIKAWKEGDSYGREFQSCFMAIQGFGPSPLPSTSASSASPQGSTFAYGVFPLKRSVIVDNGSDQHIVNDRTLLTDLWEVEPNGVYTGKSTSEYHQVGIAEIPF